MKKTLVVLLAIVMAVSLVACGQAADTEETTAATEAPAAVTAEEPTAAPEAEKVTITGKSASEVVVAGLTNVESYFGSNTLAGMQDACDEYGVKFVSSNYNGDATKEVEAVNTYVAQKVDAICSSVGETTIDLYKQAVDAGIAVGAMNTVGDRVDFLVSNVTYDQGALGDATVDYAVEFIKENLDSKPVVHMIRVIEGFKTDARGDAFMAGLAEAFGEEYGKPVSKSSGYVEAVAMQQTLDALTANPGINIIFCESENAVIGAESAIDSAGYTGKVFVFGIDGSEQMCEKLLDESKATFQGSGAQNPYEMGYTGMYRLLEVLFGERDANPEAELLAPVSINKGDLVTVQAFYDQLIELRTLSGN